MHVAGSGPTNGTLSLSANGSFTYTPNSGFSGTDTFRYVANNGFWSLDNSVPMSANSNEATVTITVVGARRRLLACSTLTARGLPPSS